MSTALITAANLSLDFELGTRQTNKVTIKRATANTDGLTSLNAAADFTKTSFSSSAAPLPFNISGSAGTADVAQRALSVDYANVQGAPVRLSQLTNDAGYVTNTALADAITNLGGTYTPDTSLPPTPTNTAVLAGLTFFNVRTDAPTYTNGHGHRYLRIYAAQWTASTPQPDFSETLLRVRQLGYVADFSANMGERWVIWTKWETVDGGVSSQPSTAIVSTTGVLSGIDLSGLSLSASQLADGSITASKLADHSITLTKFANDLEPVTIISTGLIPASYVTSMILVNGVSYRWDATTSTYVQGVKAVDISGQLISSQIANAAIQANNVADAAIGTKQLAAGSVTASTLAVTDLTNFIMSPNGDVLDGWVPMDPGMDAATNYEPWMFSRTGMSSFWSGKGVQSSSAFTFSCRDSFHGRWFRVDPGDEFWISASVAPADVTTNDYPCGLGLILSNASRSFFWYINLTSTGGAAGTISGSIRVPASLNTATQARVWFQINAPGTLENGSQYFTPATKARWNATRMVLRRKNAGNLIVDGTITATHLSSHSVTTEKLAANAVTANELSAGAVTAGKLSVDAVTAGTIAAAAVNTRELAAGAVTVDRLTVTGKGTALNPDPYFKDATAWRQALHGPLPDFVTLPAANAVVGTSAVLANNASRSLEGTIPIAVTPGKEYTISVWLRASGAVGTSYLRVVAVDGTGALLEQYIIHPTLEGFTVADDGLWHRYSASFTPALFPVGTAYMTPRLLLNHLNTAGSIYAQELILQEKVAADLIVDGAVQARHLAANSIAVGTAAIQNGAITNAMLGNAIVDTANIRTAAITTALIGDAQITAAKIVSLDAGQITTGVLAADRIGAKSITADKMVITGRGAALNADPLLTDFKAWDAAGGESVNELLCDWLPAVHDGYVGSRLFRGYSNHIRCSPVETIGVAPSKTYRVSFAYRASGGSTGSVDVLLLGMNGASVYSGNVWGHSFIGTKDAAWHRYVSANITGLTTPNVRLLLVLNRGGNEYVDVQDVRFEEMVGADLLVNGAIRADSAVVHSLDASKITTGQLDAARVNVNDILNIGANNASVQGTNVSITKYGIVIRDDSGNPMVKIGRLNML